jgi:hypothetical protein
MAVIYLVSATTSNLVNALAIARIPAAVAATATARSEAWKVPRIHSFLRLGDVRKGGGTFKLPLAFSCSRFVDVSGIGRHRATVELE